MNTGSNEAGAPPPLQIDPDFASVGNLLAAQGLKSPSIVTASIAEVRQMQDRIGAFLGLGSVPVQHEQDVLVRRTAGADVRATLYHPGGATRVPLLVYLHGGGFSQGSLPTWAPLARQVVRGSGAAVLSVDYPLAPEHPFPAALNAVVDVIEAVPRMADEWRVDAQALAIGGDSAGANLALAAAMALRAQDKARLRFLLLFYGVYSSDIGSPSWRALGQGQFGLSVDMMKEIWRYYTGQEQPAGDWRVTPLDGDFRGLPPSWACVGTLDPLLDDNLRLRDRFADAGGTCVLRICERLPHAFVRHVGRVPSVDAALAEGIAALRDAVR